jgi:hypothetical protein
MLAACSAEPEPDAAAVDPLVEAEAAARVRLAESGMVYCAVSGETEFRPACQVEQTESDAGLILTLRHPDGGFRRLLVARDGRGLVAADGAEPALVSPVSDREVEVAIAFDRYRLPATVR